MADTHVMYITMNVSLVWVKLLQAVSWNPDSYLCLC